MPPPDWLQHHRAALEYVPFASMWLGTRATDKPALTGAMEKLLIAFAAAGLAMYANDKVQDYKLAAISESIVTLKQDTRDDIRALRTDIAALTATMIARKEAK
jgi:hypothetical protein